jgi:hypothetical protein
MRQYTVFLVAMINDQLVTRNKGGILLHSFRCNFDFIRLIIWNIVPYSDNSASPWRINRLTKAIVMLIVLLIRMIIFTFLIDKYKIPGKALVVSSHS